MRKTLFTYFLVLILMQGNAQKQDEQPAKIKTKAATSVKQNSKLVNQKTTAGTGHCEKAGSHAERSKYIDG